MGIFPTFVQSRTMKYKKIGAPERIMGTGFSDPSIARDQVPLTFAPDYR